MHGSSLESRRKAFRLVPVDSREDGLSTEGAPICDRGVRAVIMEEDIEETVDVNELLLPCREIATDSGRGRPSSATISNHLIYHVRSESTPGRVTNPAA